MGRDSVYWASELARLARERSTLAKERHEALASAAKIDNAPPPISLWGPSPPPEVLAAERLRQRAVLEEVVAKCEERLARNQATDRRAREQLARTSRSEDEAVYALEATQYARRRPPMGQGLAISEEDYRRALNAVPAWVVALFAGVVLALTVLRSSASGSSTLDAVSQVVTVVVAIASLGVAIYGSECSIGRSQCNSTKVKTVRPTAAAPPSRVATQLLLPHLKPVPVWPQPLSRRLSLSRPTLRNRWSLMLMQMRPSRHPSCLSGDNAPQVTIHPVQTPTEATRGGKTRVDERPVRG